MQRAMGSFEAWLPVLLFASGVSFMLAIGWSWATYRPLFLLGDVTAGRPLCDSGSDLTSAILRRAAQVRWQASVMAVTGISIGLGTLSCWSLWRSSRTERWPQLMILGIGAGCAMAVLYGNRSGLPAELARRLGCAGVADLVHASKTLGEVAGILAGTSMSALLLVPRHLDTAMIQRRMRELRVLLYGASAMFAVGVLTSLATMEWLLSLWVPEAGAIPEAFAGAQQQLTSAGAMVAATMYTLLLGAFFVPARLSLHWHAALLAPSELTPDRRDAWLTEHGLRDSYRHVVATAVALVAPLLSGTGATLATQIAESLRQ